MVGILGLEGEGGKGFLGVKGLRMVFEGAERGDWEGRGGVGEGWVCRNGTLGGREIFVEKKKGITLGSRD